MHPAITRATANENRHQVEPRQPRRLRYGRRGGHPPRRHYRTPRDSFPSRGSSVTRVPVIGIPLGAIAHPRNLAHAQSGLDLRPVFSTPGHPASVGARLRPRLFLSPRLLACRPHVSISPALPEALGFLGHPSRQGIRPGRLLRQRRRAVDGLLRSVCPFSVILGRHCTPRPSYRVITTYAHTTWPNGDVSLLGLPVSASTDFSRLAGSNSRRLRAFVEHPDLGHPLEASPLSASSLHLHCTQVHVSPFFPCTPTLWLGPTGLTAFDSHSPAVG